MPGIKTGRKNTYPVGQEINLNRAYKKKKKANAAVLQEKDTAIIGNRLKTSVTKYSGFLKQDK